MTKKSTDVRGIFTAANDQYHGVASIREHGALAHANCLARVLLREGRLASEEEAVSVANFEVQRLRAHENGFQGNRMARYELRDIRDKDREDARLRLMSV